MADEQRIAVLETHIRTLYEQVASLRAELAALHGGAPAPAPAAASPPALQPAPAAPPPPRAAPPRDAPRAAPRAPAIDFEELAGRYGTIAVASLAILMGVGTFLSWAIQHGLLGPAARVVLGFIGAAIVVGIGVWVRERHDVRFGNLLLALALAIVHLDAWAAGPHLHVLRPVAALAIAAVASFALAALALTSEERTLFVIGFAGALIAPFVTASEPGSVVLLLSYGWVVIATGIFAIRERGWRPVLWLTVAGAAMYVVASSEGPGLRDASWLATHVDTLFAFACAAAALLWARGALRSKLALAFLLVACFATLLAARELSVIQIALPLAGTAAAYAITRELETDRKWQVIGNVIIPLSFLFATLLTATDRSARSIAAVALTVLASLLAWDADEEERSQHLFVTAIASGIAIVAYLADYDARCIGALALHAALFAVVMRTTRAKILAYPIFAGLTIASLWALLLLERRPAFEYTPFWGIPSLCALAAVAAWATFAYAASSDERAHDPHAVTLAELVGILTILAAFVWVRQELLGAFSPDMSAFLLILYYAIAGLALIFAGRWRRVGVWRAAGLAFAFYAGYKALAETWSIDAVSLRVGARILVGIFLAAVAYWYRAPRDPKPEGVGAAPSSAA
jgi:uncharacterized membrane protein